MKQQRLSVREYLDPCSVTGLKIFTGHEKKFIKKHCHFATGDDNITFMARTALFRKTYRLIWVRTLESREWKDERMFLGYIDFFSEFISQDKSVINLIDEKKWNESERVHDDIFNAVKFFFILNKIGDEQVAEYTINNYFPPGTSREERLTVSA